MVDESIVPTTAVPLDPLLSLVDNAPDVISRFDREGRYLFVSAAAERATGIPRSAFLGRTYRQLGFSEENCALWDDSLRSAFETGEPGIIEFDVTVPALGLRHYEGYTVAERGTDGTVVSVLTVTRDITDRVNALSALNEAAKHRQRSSDVFRLVDKPLVIGTEASRLIEVCNPAFARMYGYTPDEMVGMPVSACYAPSFRDRVNGYIDQAHSTGHAAFTADHIRRDGTEFPVEVDMTAVKDEDGRVLYRIVNVTDITDRRRTESERDATLSALEASESRLRLALSAARMGTWEWDPITGALQWAGNLEEIHGMGTGSFDGTFDGFFSRVHEDDRGKLQSDIVLALEQGGDFATEFRVLYPDNSIHWVAGEGRAFHDASGRPDRMVGVGWDITEHKQIEEKLQAQQDLLRTITDNADSALVMMDVRGHITFVNPAFFRITGYTADDVQGRALHDVIHYKYPDGRPFPIEECPIDHSYSNLQPIQGHEDVFVRKDGTLFPVVCAVAPQERDGRTVGGVLEFRDASRSKEIETELRSLANREALLNRIGEVIRTRREPGEILTAAVAELGAALEADRCYFAEYDLNRDWTRVGADWHRSDLPSLIGTYRLSEFDIDVRELYGPSGLMCTSDIFSEATPFSRRGVAALNALGLRSGVAVALFEEGLPVAALTAAMADTARTWTPEEVDLVQTATTLIRSAMEEARLREKEHRIAERLQVALQPDLPVDVNGLDPWAFYRPALQEASIGGDFYDVFPFDEDCYALVVADLSGKGLAAAAEISTVRHMLRALVYQRGSTLAQSVTLLNGMLSEHSLLSGFATLFIGVYDANNGTLTYVNAGQEPGLILRNSTGAIEELGPTGPVLGGFGEATFEEQSARLLPGDVLALFTDGLTEAGPSRKDLLEIKGIVQIFASCAGDCTATPREITTRIMAGVEAAATPAGIRDDVCLLVTRIG
jgi:PAS domain S-box-containing protein